MTDEIAEAHAAPTVSRRGKPVNAKDKRIVEGDVERVHTSAITMKIQVLPSPSKNARCDAVQTMMTKATSRTSL